MLHFNSWGEMKIVTIFLLEYENNVVLQRIGVRDINSLKIFTYLIKTISNQLHWFLVH